MHQIVWNMIVQDNNAHGYPSNSDLWTVETNLGGSPTVDLAPECANNLQPNCIFHEAVHTFAHATYEFYNGTAYLAGIHGIDGHLTNFQMADEVYVYHFLSFRRSLIQC